VACKNSLAARRTWVSGEQQTLNCWFVPEFNLLWGDKKGGKNAGRVLRYAG